MRRIPAAAFESDAVPLASLLFRLPLFCGFALFVGEQFRVAASDHIGPIPCFFERQIGACVVHSDKLNQSGQNVGVAESFCAFKRGIKVEALVLEGMEASQFSLFDHESDHRMESHCEPPKQDHIVGTDLAA